MMGRPSRATFPHASRSWSHFRWRIAFVVFIFAVVQQQRLYFIYRDALRAKYSATDFRSNFAELRPRLWRPDDEDAQFQDELIANRDSWKVLESGWEGKTFVYKDSVVKTFTPGRSPFRNCAPGVTNEKWPTEIPASLYFGDSSHDFQPQVSKTLSHNENSTFGGFLPVKAYFQASLNPSAPVEWHLVTPLVRGGNLNTLAKTQKPASFREIDTRFRPALNRLLRILSGFHEAGFCHDDVKPNNIFIEDDQNWVLGDLGNVRHILHPYHYSRIWRDNGQLRDCRANDVFRALKTYLYFVREASNDPAYFNAEFFDNNTPLMRLFWWAVRDAPTISAAELKARSIIESPSQPPTFDSHVEDVRVAPSRRLVDVFLPRDRALKNTVDGILAMGNSETLARWMGLTRVFGLPRVEGC